MKSKSRSRFRSGLPAAAALLVLAAVVFFSLYGPKTGRSAKIVNTAIDSRNLTYFDFDNRNQKRLEIKCLESLRRGDDQLLMKNITATFFKTEKLEKDIHVVGDSGIVSSNFYNFDIRGHARISSSDFFLSSQSFYLQNRELLTSKEGVDFKLKNTSGRAAAGMEYYINLPVLKLFQCRGSMTRNGQPYDFRTGTFWVIKKDNLLVLQKNSELTGAGAIARSDWMSLQFDRDFEHLQSMSNFGNCFFTMTEKAAQGPAPRREISAELIRMDYDPDGRLRQVTVHGDGKISLRDQKNSGQLVSEITHIFLRGETQTLEKVQTLTRGTLACRGRDNVTVSGDTLTAFYSPDGLLVEIKAQKNCEFSAEGFQGTAPAFNYDAALFLVDITGRDATMVSNKNSFISSHFQIHSRQRQLNAEKGVKATIMPRGKNVLLSSKPLFITAGAMELTDRGNVIRFRDKVKLFQDDIELHAGDMVLDNPNNRMSFSGGADLKFINDNELLVLRGQVIFFNAAERKIIITGNASLNQAENILGGRQIELAFDRANLLDTIVARDNVTFRKEDLSGKSGLLHWYFNKKTVLFKNSAQITRKNGGTTKGKELLLNLISKEIKVSSQDDRAETIITQGQP